jgi:hypothetical protein
MRAQCEREGSNGKVGKGRLEWKVEMEGRRKSRKADRVRYSRRKARKVKKKVGGEGWAGTNRVERFVRKVLEVEEFLAGISAV